MYETMRKGQYYGTGSAINVEVGFVPDRVEIINVTDGTKVFIGFPSRTYLPFTSGGTNEIQAGDIIVGATSGARATVISVNKVSGTWAGGDAAGLIEIDPLEKTGTFASENVYATDTASGTNDATVTVDLPFCVDIDTEVAGVTSNGITAYAGSPGSAAQGFTVGTNASTSAKFYIWTAYRAQG